MQELSLQDFFRGILCGLRLGGTTRVAYDSVSWSLASERCYRALDAIESELGIEMRFAIIPHPIHQDSGYAAGGLTLNQDIAPFEAPQYDAFNLRLSPEEALRILEQIQPRLELQLWRELATTFDEALQGLPERSVVTRRRNNGPLIL